MVGDGSAGFPSTMRLKKKDEFVRVFREGTVWKGSCLSVHVLPRTAEVLQSQKRGPRLGMVVTRKVGSAVVRNRIKRKIREAFRKTAYRLPTVDLVIKPTAACKQAPEEEIVRSIEQAVKRVLESVKEKK